MKTYLYGAIFGDILGSTYEGQETKLPKCPNLTTESRFTDDTVLLLATAHALRLQKSYAETYYEFYQRYPKIGYGTKFSEWAWFSGSEPYFSFGNGAIMRALPIGYLPFGRIWKEAKKSALPTHNHPQGIKGARTIAVAIALLKKFQSKQLVLRFLQIAGYKWKSVTGPQGMQVTCPETMKICARCFSESKDFMSAVNLSIQKGGDTDTQACITGELASCLYEIPQAVIEVVEAKLDAFLLQELKAWNQWIK